MQPRTSNLILFNFSSLQRFNFDRALASQAGALVALAVLLVGGVGAIMSSLKKDAD